MNPATTQIVGVTLDRGDVRKLDAVAARAFMTRAAYARMLILQNIQAETATASTPKRESEPA